MTTARFQTLKRLVPTFHLFADYLAILLFPYGSCAVGSTGNDRSVSSTYKRGGLLRKLAASLPIRVHPHPFRREVGVGKVFDLESVVHWKALLTLLWNGFAVAVFYELQWWNDGTNRHDQVEQILNTGMDPNPTNSIGMKASVESIVQYGRSDPLIWFRCHIQRRATESHRMMHHNFSLNS
jgi:hypothetical protein